ncbi:MAG: hypothetical protein U0167_04660 [bacterium]
MDRLESPHAEPMGENHDDPVIAPTVYTTLIFVAVFVITLIGLQAYFGRAVSSEEQEKLVDPSSVALAKLREEQQARLSGYRWVSADSGLVAIPISRAMALEAADLAGRASQAPAAAPAVAPASDARSRASAAKPSGAAPPMPTHHPASPRKAGR